MQSAFWGQINYAKAQEQQLLELEKVASGSVQDQIVFCSHDPVVTIGRGTKAGDTFSWQGETLETSRGGRATYHGPSQTVIYPIIDLKKQRKNIPMKDIHAYLRALETAAVKSLAQFSISAEVRSVSPESGEPSLTGVWVGDKKIASIGIAVKKWVTYHGIAINLFNDQTAFQGINPCGFKSEIMTSIESVLGEKIPRKKFEDVCRQIFEGALS